METFKGLLAEAKYCVQFGSILHTLLKYCREYRTGCVGFVQCSRDSPQFAQVVVIVESADKTALAVCSLVRVSAEGASCSFGGNKISTGSNLLI